MEKFTVDGVVIKTSVTGEADRIVWVLTRDRGIIRAFAKGARGTKSRLHGGTSLFCYCEFTFSEKNNVYNINYRLNYKNKLNFCQCTIKHITSITLDIFCYLWYNKQVI